ncbi:tetratricopeptide repeat protein [Tenacibaculum amylolyticum]|uniref:tetratricopeptide repeat protein n=1 Tax=Tenacibaculum amylolyticum TaxID=104269 RepID=UPI0038967B46
MNPKVLLYFLLFSFVVAFSQNGKVNGNDVLIEKIVKEKTSNYFELDSLFYNNGRNNKSLTEQDYQKLYDKSLKNKYTIGQIYAANSLGRIYRRKSNYKKATEYHKEALKLAKSIGDIDIRIITLNLLGVCYRRQDDVRNALNYHQSALSLANKIKNPTIENKKSISISENSIGNIYMTLHQYDLALEKFEKAIQIQKELKNKRGLAINYQNIGFAQENLLFYDDAIENYNKSLQLNKEINSELGKIICYNSLGSVYTKTLQHPKALQIMEEIFPIASKFENKYYYARTLANLGLAQIKNKQFKKAETTLKEALEVSKKYGFKKSLISSYFYLSELHEELGDHTKAIDFYKKAVALEKNTLGQQTIAYVNNLISKHDLQSKINEINYLESQSKIETLKFFRNRNILIITLITIALLSIALYSIYRQRLLNNDRKILLLEQQALQTQMNPHFIFNALNSIKLYIINNEQRQAVYYLNKFSKLIRNILDVSKVKEVSLKEELATMDLYMSIENIRFSNEINYKVEINPDLNSDTIKVPPLILQPFLENAIWHGLSSKEGEKQITLTANKIEGNLVEVNIIDNGIGRGAAGEIKKRKSLKRKSIGIDLTKERLKTFSEDYDNESSLKYYDLKNEDGTSAGTKVSIIFSLV